MLIKTNYSGPYRIKRVCRDPRPGRHYVDIVCTRPDGSGEFYLNRWSEDTLRSADKSFCGFKTEMDYDRIDVLGIDVPIQRTMF